MSSYNKVIIMGRIVRDLELRVTPKGMSVCQLGLAVNSSYKTKDGESREETTFVDVDAFGKQAEVLAKYLRKGSPILVDGRLKLDQFEDKEGNKRSKLKVVLESFTFVGGRQDGEESAAPDTRKSSRDTTPESVQNNTQGAGEEDVPW